MLPMYGKKCWPVIVRNLVLSMILVTTTESSSLSSSLLKNMPPQTTTDAKFILSSVRFPGSFSVLNSRTSLPCVSHVL